ncbi:MAG: hypothetical protein ACI84D_001054 [Thalassolituus oleivorans]|jgi:hypothetical protein
MRYREKLYEIRSKKREPTIQNIRDLPKYKAISRNLNVASKLCCLWAVQLWPLGCPGFL